MSESQERMMAVVAPDNLDAFLAVCAQVGRRRPTVLGEVTDGDRLVDATGTARRSSTCRRARVAARGPGVPPAVAAPDDQDALQADAPRRLPRPGSRRRAAGAALQLVASPNLADKSWVTDQYDRYVQGNTVLAQPDDAGVVRRSDEAATAAASRVSRGRQRPVRAGSTRTPARSSRWPRPTATSRPPAPGRSPSPTASTSARRRTRR